MYCTKCGHQNPDDGKFCASCGTPVSGQAAYPSTDRTSKVNIVAYASGSIRANLVSFFLGALLLVEILYIVFGYMEYELVGRIMRGDYFTFEEVMNSDDRIDALGIIWFIIVPTIAILFLVWIYRAYKNLYSFGCTNLKHSPGWAIGWFFVPILNLWKPYQVMQEIWKASDPDTNVNNGSAWQSSSPTPLILAWWLLFVVHPILWIFAGRLLGSDYISEIYTGTWLRIIVHGLMIIPITLEILIIQNINTRQERKRQLVFSSTQMVRNQSPS